MALTMIESIITGTIRNEIDRQDGDMKRNVFEIRELQSLTISIADRSNEPKLQEVLNNVTDEFHSGDPLTSEETMNPKIDMCSLIGDWRQDLAEEDNEAAKVFLQQIASMPERAELNLQSQ